MSRHGSFLHRFGRRVLLISLLLNLAAVVVIALAVYAPGGFVRAVAGYDPIGPWYDQKASLFPSLDTGRGGIVLAGDSLIDHGRWAEAFPDLSIRNFGIAGDTTDGLLQRLDPVIDLDPQVIVVMIGTNDVGVGLEPATVTANIQAIADRLSTALPGARVVLHTLFPRSRQYAERIAEINAAIREIARAGGHDLLDLHDRFADDQGAMRPEYSNDDLHLLGTGYALWRDALLPCLTTACPAVE